MVPHPWIFAVLHFFFQFTKFFENFFGAGADAWKGRSESHLSGRAMCKRDVPNCT